MEKNKIIPVNSDFLKNVSEALTKAQRNAKTAANLSMVHAYFEIGKIIVEKEQPCANRAAYGTNS